jgi:heme-degrading monooxygenase HmoA
MVITTLDAQVPPEKWAALEQAYKQSVSGEIDSGLVETFLLHNLREPNQWRIATVWASREALDAMRSSGQTPRGVLIFRAAGAEPTLSISEVVSYTREPGGKG